MYTGKPANGEERSGKFFGGFTEILSKLLVHHWKCDRNDFIQLRATTTLVCAARDVILVLRSLLPDSYLMSRMFLIRYIALERIWERLNSHLVHFTAAVF